MIIDAHVHLIRPCDDRGRPQVYTPGRPSSAEDYVATMDRSGIDRAFFISWSPEDIPADLMGKGIAVDAVRQTLSREYALEVLRRYPERFYWFPCHLGPQVPDHARMARQALELGAAGLKLVPSFWGELPDAARLLPLYRLAASFDAQVILDTSFWYLGKDEPTDPGALPPGHREVARQVRDFADYLAHLQRVVEGHPQVRFQLAHAGARSFTPEHARQVGAFIRQYPHVFADLGALSPELPALEALVEAAGADRVLFGTDWPHFARDEGMSHWLDAVRRPGRFPPPVVRAILGGNALRFVGDRPTGVRP
ncbi:MAG: amidohydrolase family protein [Candidatus Latescibacterota bacterium]